MILRFECHDARQFDHSRGFIAIPAGQQLDLHFEKELQQPSSRNNDKYQFGVLSSHQKESKS
jgi:hypothetical protein